MEGVDMVKEKKDIDHKQVQLRRTLRRQSNSKKKRVLQGGFAELEAIIWTSLLITLSFSLTEIYRRIEDNTINEIKVFENEWNKIKI